MTAPRTARPASLVTPHWRAGLIGVFVAVCAYQGQAWLDRAALTRYAGRITSPLAHLVLVRVGPLALPFDVAAAVVWAVGVAGMLGALAVCAHELALVWKHQASPVKRSIAAAVTLLIGWYCGAWVLQAVLLTTAYRLAILPPL